MKRGKRYLEMAKKIDKTISMELDTAIELLKQIVISKFDETVEVNTKLGVDPRHANQQVRGTVLLPHGTGKKVRVLVFAKGEYEKQAEEAGADFVGSEEIIQKIQEGWLDFDAAIATPDMMGMVSRLGKTLGPRGLMPNPKSGTVTFEVAKAVKDIKAGKIEYRVDKGGNINVPIGKISFSKEQLKENCETFFQALIKAKPASVKGQYLRNAAIAATMSPGIKLNVQSILNLAR